MIVPLSMGRADPNEVRETDDDERRVNHRQRPVISMENAMRRIGNFRDRGGPRMQGNRLCLDNGLMELHCLALS